MKWLDEGEIFAASKAYINCERVLSFLLIFADIYLEILDIEIPTTN